MKKVHVVFIMIKTSGR